MFILIIAVITVFDVITHLQCVDTLTRQTTTAHLVATIIA
jgi:hypothetical protein